MTEERILTSAANFYVGEKLQLRPDMGGGWWLVVEILPRVQGFAACKVVPLYCCPMRRTVRARKNS